MRQKRYYNRRPFINVSIVMEALWAATVTLILIKLITGNDLPWGWVLSPLWGGYLILSLARAIVAIIDWFREE